MQRVDIGGRGYHKVTAAATSTFQPLFDRAAIVRRILINTPSANDVWRISVNGAEVGAFRIDTVGNQQLLGGTAANYPKAADIFSYAAEVLGVPITYPIPQGATITVKSDGGATANITLEYTEQDAADLVPSTPNYPGSKRWLAPIYLHPKTSITHASGSAEDDFAAQSGLSFLPTMYGLTELPAGWTLDILAIFAEGLGRNTFSGSADHQSVSDHIALILNGQRMFTRDTLDGVPNIGPASAAGSANTVYGAVESPLPAFQIASAIDYEMFPTPLQFRGGTQFEWLFGTTGDSTGGADYSHGYLVLLCDIRTGVAA